MRALAIALRSLSREWRYGELAVLLFSLSVAVGRSAASDFWRSHLARDSAQASEILAADIRVNRDRRWRRGRGRGSQLD
jgi:predicted lysophospholipase L1 biosynthesis ABC-type transport system permease subunit